MMHTIVEDTLLASILAISYTALRKKYLIYANSPSKNKLQDNLNSTVTAGEVIETILPLCPSIHLYLLSSDYPRGRLDQDEMLAIMSMPAYWAFCWASGQVLAAYILTHQEKFRDKTILDFGSGSGVVAIAAAMAGASEVIACDIDPHALDACKVNARLNQVKITCIDDFSNLEIEPDLIIAADVLYDRDNFHFIDAFLSQAKEVLISDSRIRKWDPKGYKIVDRVQATTIPDLDELKEYSDVRLYYYGSQVRDPSTSVGTTGLCSG